MKFLFSSNEKCVILERDSGNRLILKTKKSSHVLEESGTVYVADQEEDDCFKPADLNDISMVDWTDEFYKIYFRKNNDSKAIGLGLGLDPKSWNS